MRLGSDPINHCARATRRDGHPRGRPRHPRMRLGGRHRVLPNAPHRAHRPLVAARGFARRRSAIVRGHAEMHWGVVEPARRRVPPVVRSGYHDGRPGRSRGCIQRAHERVRRRDVQGRARPLQTGHRLRRHHGAAERMGKVQREEVLRRALRHHPDAGADRADHIRARRRRIQRRGDAHRRRRARRRRRKWEREHARRASTGVVRETAAVARTPVETAHEEAHAPEVVRERELALVVVRATRALRRGGHRERMREGRFDGENIR